jgi:acetyl esterase/lipase
LVTEGHDGTIQGPHNCFVDGGKSMKHAAFNKAWPHRNTVLRVRLGWGALTREVKKVRTFFVMFAARIMALAGGILYPATSLLGEVPPAPPGYATEDEVKQAYNSGKLRIINLAIDVPDTVSVERNIEYGKGGDISLKLDLYSPKGNAKPVPAVLFIHGGAWKGGYRQMYHYYCTKFAEHGYVAATISYRLTSDAPFPAAVEDAKCAVRWLRANAEKLGVDPNGIGVAGGSAGGHLSMMVGYSPDTPELEGKGGHGNVSSRVQAVVDLYGPTDLTTEAARSESNVIRFLGDKTMDEEPELYQLASPITHVTKDDPPTLILHGSIDDTVTIDHAERLVDALKKADVEYVFDRVEGWPHAMDLEPDVNRHCLMRMFEFFEKHLGPPSKRSNSQ